MKLYHILIQTYMHDYTISGWIHVRRKVKLPWCIFDLTLVLQLSKLLNKESGTEEIQKTKEILCSEMVN